MCAPLEVLPKFLLILWYGSCPFNTQCLECNCGGNLNVVLNFYYLVNNCVDWCNFYGHFMGWNKCVHEGGSFSRKLLDKEWVRLFIDML